MLAQLLKQEPVDRALVFTRTAAFRHTECIPQGTAAIGEMGGREHFAVDATEDPNAFNDANLAKYDVVIWLCTTGDVLNDTQQAAFERYIRAGGGYTTSREGRRTPDRGPRIDDRQRSSLEISDDEIDIPPFLR